jgi:hypothetical protein
MDPYLESDDLWPAFHHQLISSLYQIFLPGLGDRYRARIAQRHYRAEDASSMPAGSAEHREEFVEIYQRTDGNLVTLVDVVSPANKTTAAGRAAYLDKRKEGRNANANLIEIDLVLQGQPTLEYSRAGLPDWDYAVTVTRATQPERYEIYTTTLQKRLPRFRLPLAGDDRDTVLDLQAAFLRAYDEGKFAGRIDYRQDPPVPLGEEDRHWLGILLAEKKLRDQGGVAIPHEKIALAAYYLWQNEGCQPGCDTEYWHRAIEQLEREVRNRKPRE